MGGVVGALVYLRVTTLRNAVVSRFTRLKQPKYLIGAIVGVAYVYGVIIRGATANRPPGAPLAQPFPVEAVPTIASLGALLLMVFVALYWLWPRTRAALTFSEAEIAFLFPAPISRKTLIHYRWINTQLRILFTSLLLALFSTRWSFLLGGAGIRIVGWWLLLSTLDLHAIGSSFAITRLLDRGMTTVRRQLLAVAVAAIVLAVAIVAASRSLHTPAAADLGGPLAFARYLASLVSSGPLSWLLAPARWVVQPLVAPDAGTWFAAIGPALLVYALHYAWVLRAEVSFEEASIAKAERRAARMSAMQREGTLRLGRAERKARRAPFKLAAISRPEAAFLWKNLLSSASYLRPRVALIVAAVIVLAGTWITRMELDVLRTTVSVVAMVAAGYTFVFGPIIARQDLRQDLPNADILKTYPLRGWQVVLGEVLAPIAIVTVLLWLMLLAAALTFQPPRADWWTPGLGTVAILAIALLLPFLSAIEVLVMNAATLLFPAWMPRGRAQGIDVLGQRIFVIAGVFITMILTLVPVGVGATAIFFATLWVVGVPAATALAGVAALAILLVEVGLSIAWLGNRFESFDLSAELRP